MSQASPTKIQQKIKQYEKNFMRYKWIMKKQKQKKQGQSSLDAKQLKTKNQAYRPYE